VQPEAISSYFTTYYLGKGTDTHLTTTSFQVVLEGNKVSSQLPLLQTKQPQFPQLLPIRLVLQTLHQPIALLWTRSSTSMSFLE